MSSDSLIVHTVPLLFTGAGHIPDAFGGILWHYLLQPVDHRSQRLTDGSARPLPLVICSCLAAQGGFFFTSCRHTHIHKHLYTHTQTHTHKHKHLHSHKHLYTYTHTPDTHTHTHTHTYWHLRDATVRIQAWLAFPCFLCARWCVCVGGGG